MLARTRAAKRSTIRIGLIEGCCAAVAKGALGHLKIVSLIGRLPDLRLRVGIVTPSEGGSSASLGIAYG